MGRLLGFLENISYLCIVIKKTMFHRSYKSTKTISATILAFTPFIVWIYGYFKIGSNMFSKAEIFMMAGFGVLADALFYLLIFCVG